MLPPSIRAKPRRAMVRLAAVLVFTFGASAAIAAVHTIVLAPTQDAPILGNEFSGNANGAGETLFVGTNGTGSPRRSLLAFDFSPLGGGVVVTGATLTMTADREPNTTPQVLSLHVVTESWTTGASNSAANPGQGVPAQPGDTTWFYRSYNTLPWTTAGGSFNAAISASQTVGALGTYSWSGPGMVADVNAWLANPGQNFGWIMTGNEGQTQTVKRFISREGLVNAELRPHLALTYETVPIPEPATSLSLGLGLLLIALWQQRRGSIGRG